MTRYSSIVRVVLLQKSMGEVWFQDTWRKYSASTFRAFKIGGDVTTPASLEGIGKIKSVQ